ncbi:SDR family NAD(P)-dependent oxidoreductase [Geomicrobium sediminis]|uniref:NAD(P)-dependent dehydrogenase (Short-subunit alcohol dehydrogenase family) n=1 Tax=Geomicrobium sediminis TaxID=1347788 RepID=A0ABS2PD99_9BACL|nr:glucose 1-dehydrogenase [Geomicrobium sediminis]MBM7633405.1 NAD(P)-dependent dehydrogenase (short-subunit alcohol dehydrogenase family) [Geomicrobium sediminis]
MRLRQKIAIITGGGSGIGQRTAIRFANEGATVVIADIDPENGQQTADALKGDQRFIRTDTTDASSVHEMVEKVIEEYGRIDVLFNNAGVSGVGRLHEVDEHDWDRVMNINVKGVFLPSKSVIPHMIKAESGVIVNMSSCIAEIGLGERASYATSKGAVLSLTKQMQVDYAKYNIRVNALLPGTIMTPFVEDYLSRAEDPDKAIAKIKTRQLSGDLGKPEDVADAALFLASDDSRFMMGSPLYVDGGVVFGKDA